MLSPASHFPYRQGMKKLSQIFTLVFTTKFLTSMVCVLVAVLLLKGLSNYYDFDWTIALVAQ
jgi:hypothetical protein